MAGPWEKYGGAQQANPVIAPPDPYKQQQATIAQQGAVNDQVRTQVAVHGDQRQQASDSWTILTPEEVAAQRLPTGPTYQRNGLGEIKAVGDVKATPNPREAALQTVKSIGIDLMSPDDRVARLIEGSTSGGLEAGAAAVSGFFGKGTPGMENIGQLKAIVSDLTLAATGGGLGNQISNADRDFIIERMGNIADPTVPANVRLAAWQEVKGRLARSLGVELPAPAGTAGDRKDDDLAALGTGAGLTGETSDSTPSPFDPGGQLNPATQQAAAMDKSLRQYGIGDLARQGMMLGLGDEAAGFGQAIGQALGGDFNIADNYRKGRDSEEIRLEEARKHLGWTGTVAEFAGGMALPANALASGVGAAAKGGAYAGAVGGFGYGRGGQQSTVNALIGAPLGAGIAYGGGKLVNALSERSAALAPSADQVAVIEAGQRQGVPIRQPDVRPELRSRAGATARSQGGKDLMAAAGNEDVQAIEGAITRNVAGGAQAVERETAGRGVQSSMAAQREASSTTRGALYKRVRKLTPGFRAEPTESTAYLDAQIAEFKGKGLDDRAAALTDLRDQITRDGLTVDSVQGLRQKVRDLVNKSNLDMDALDATATRLQKIAGDELASLMEARGLGGAASILQRANKLTAEQHQFREQVVRQLLGPSNNPKSGEQIFDTIRSWTQNDFSRLARLHKELPPEEARELAATIAISMGRDAGGKFSFTSFLRAVAGEPGMKPGVSPQAQRLLFGEDGVRAINDLRSIVRAKSDAAKGEMLGGPTQGAVNRLGRGVRSMIITLIGAGVGAKVGGVEGAVGMGAAVNVANRFFDRMGEQRAARLLMNPDFTKWLRRLPDTANPRAIDHQFKQLDALAAKSPGMLADVEAFQNALIQSANDNAASMASAARDEDSGKGK